MGDLMLDKLYAVISLAVCTGQLGMCMIQEHNSLAWPLHVTLIGAMLLLMNYAVIDEWMRPPVPRIDMIWTG